MSTATTFTPTQEVMDEWRTLAPVLALAGLRQDVWTTFATTLGDKELDDIATFAGLDDQSLAEARAAAEIPFIQKAAINRLFCIVKNNIGWQPR